MTAAIGFSQAWVVLSLNPFGYSCRRSHFKFEALDFRSFDNRKTRTQRFAISCYRVSQYYLGVHRWTYNLIRELISWWVMESRSPWQQLELSSLLIASSFGTNVRAPEDAFRSSDNICIHCDKCILPYFGKYESTAVCWFSKCFNQPHLGARLNLG